MSKKPEPEKKLIQFHVTPEEKEKIVKKAEAETRSIANWIKHIILKEV